MPGCRDSSTTAGVALSGPLQQIRSNYRVRSPDAITETLGLLSDSWQKNGP